MKVFRTLGMATLALLVSSGIALSQEPFAPGQWAAVTAPPQSGIGHIQLLTDGSVLAQNSNCATTTGIWYRLVPSKTGSYVGGHWVSAGTTSGYNPLYFASQVLPSGHVVVMGGEYNGNGAKCNAVWTTLGAMYNPNTNTWTPMPAPAGWTSIGDAQSVLLPRGVMMLANCCTTDEAFLTFPGGIATWTATGAGKFDSNDEEGWTLLPGGKVLAVDAYTSAFDPTGTNSEIYTASSGTWASAGSTVKQLWDSAASCGGSPSYEVGPAVLRPNGTVFATGANGCGAGHTAIYNSKTNIWRAGPDFTGLLDIADGPAALLPDGNVLVDASPGIYNTGSKFFEWDGAALHPTTAPPNAPVDSSYYGEMLVLPTGQIMFSDGSSSVEIYTPSGSACAGCAPTVTSVASILTHGTVNNVIKGTQFNGLSLGAAYGDDSQNSTNFPLVRITDSLGNVVYCRTHTWPGGVATGAKVVTALFDIPATIAIGPATLEVVANGIPSAAVAVTIS